MRTGRNRRRSFSVELKAPQSWRELSQRQLRYVLQMLWTHDDTAEVKTLMFFRLTGLQVVRSIRGGVVCSLRQDGTLRRFTVMAWQVQQLMHQFDYIDKPDTMDVRLEAVRGCRAVDVVLHGVSFGDYLSCEKYYQAFLASKRIDMLNELGRLLYRKPDGSKPDPWQLDEAEQACCFLWFGHVKAVLSRQFHKFFRPVGGVESPGFVQSMNAQIRALTGGDITQEERVLQCDCWRALTELNEKAREAEEFERKYGK